jgi:hypothetical protein
VSATSDIAMEANARRTFAPGDTAARSEGTQATPHRSGWEPAVDGSGFRCLGLGWMTEVSHRGRDDFLGCRIIRQPPCGPSVGRPVLSARHAPLPIDTPKRSRIGTPGCCGVPKIQWRLGRRGL